jgi:hypothetical protein
MTFEYLLFVCVYLGLAVTVVYCVVTGITPVSSTRSSRKAIFASLPTNPQGIIFELGAGWGSLAFPLARRYPRNRVVAFELSPVPWLFMNLRWLFTQPSNLVIHRRNFLKADLSAAGIIVCYLYPRAMERLAPKLKKELHADTLVISNTFEIPDWTPDEVKNLEDTMCPNIFIYQMGTEDGQPSPGID